MSFSEEETSSSEHKISSPEHEMHEYPYWGYEMSSSEHGRIKDPCKETYVEWEIDRFFSMVPDSTGTTVTSPYFHFANATWELQLEPNGCTKDKNDGWIAIYLKLKKYPKNENISIHFTLGIKCDDKKLSRSKHELFDEGTRHGSARYIRRFKLYQRRKELALGNTLTIFCRTNISSKKRDGTSSLSEDLKTLFDDEKDYDATINVKGRLFRVHKLILGSRSPVLSAMFQHNMKESNSNTVNIPDIDPDIFHDFLLFLYSGKTENLSSNNVVYLYNLADKYIVRELKQICVDFLEFNLNLDNICDILTLADRHRDEQLKEVASEWVKNNLKEIVKIDQWVTFMAENSQLAAELLRKALSD